MVPRMKRMASSRGLNLVTIFAALIQPQWRSLLPRAAGSANEGRNQYVSRRDGA